MVSTYEFEMKDMPVTIAVSADGTSAHTAGLREWQSQSREIPVAGA